MNIGFIADHVVKPQFTAGSNYDATIIASVDQDSGFTLEFSFAELSVPAYWHFNVDLEETDAKAITAKRIALDELKGLVDLIGEPIEDTQDLVGKAVTVRLLSQSDSNLPKLTLPIASKRNCSLAI